MNSYTGIQLILIGIGAFVLMRVILGGYRRAFDRDRRIGKFLLSPFVKDSPGQRDPEGGYSGKDVVFISVGILLQIMLLVLFVYLIDSLYLLSHLLQCPHWIQITSGNHGLGSRLRGNDNHEFHELHKYHIQ